MKMHGRLVKNLFIDNHWADFQRHWQLAQGILGQRKFQVKTKEGSNDKYFYPTWWNTLKSLVKLVSCKGHVSDVTQGTLDLVIKYQFISYQDHIIIIILALSK